jgi:hypothetical protein
LLGNDEFQKIFSIRPAMKEVGKGFAKRPPSDDRQQEQQNKKHKRTKTKKEQNL